MCVLVLSLSAQEHVLSQCQSQYIKAKVSTSHHMKKEKEACEALKKSQKLIAIKEQELAEERQEISELETIRRNYATQQKKKGTSMERVIELDEDQVSMCWKTLLSVHMTLNIVR